VGSDLPLAGGKTKIPERHQEQMCGLPTSRLYIQPTDKALAYETRRWDASGRVCIISLGIRGVRRRLEQG
jgi:hypothetical protein